jgi:hypothetical protein
MSNAPGQCEYWAGNGITTGDEANGFAGNTIYLHSEIQTSVRELV